MNVKIRVWLSCIMVGVGSPIHKSASLARLHSHSPSQAMAKKLVRKYSLGSRHVTQRKELTALRTSLPNVRAASDFEVVMAAIKYIESLQNQVVFLNSRSTTTTTTTLTSTTRSQVGEEKLDVDNMKTPEKVEKNNN